MTAVRATRSSQLDLDAIEARANAATPGPWTSQRNGNSFVFDRCVGQSRIPELRVPFNRAALANESRTVHDVFLVDADADFVADAREDVPALVAEVRRLRFALEAVCDADAGGAPTKELAEAREEACRVLGRWP